jgi:serine/threonine-protein kinase RIM15
LYGFPPFNADTPHHIFENILHHRLEWHEDSVSFSYEVLDLMKKLLNADANQRLGARGAQEVKAHPWFKDVPWNTLNTEPPNFVPKVQKMEDTEYFDGRGVQEQTFEEEPEQDASGLAQVPRTNSKKHLNQDDKSGNKSSKLKDVDFGGFMYKNLPLLEKANQKLVEKLQSGLTSADKLKTRSLLQLRQSASPSTVAEVQLTNLMRSFSLKEGRSRTVSGGDASDVDSPPSPKVDPPVPRRPRRLSAPFRSRNASEGSRKPPNLSPLASFALTRGSLKSYSLPKSSVEPPNPPPATLDVLIAVS